MKQARMNSPTGTKQLLKQQMVCFQSVNNVARKKVCNTQGKKVWKNQQTDQNTYFARIQGEKAFSKDQIDIVVSRFRYFALYRKKIIDSSNRSSNFKNNQLYPIVEKKIRKKQFITNQNSYKNGLTHLISSEQLKSSQPQSTKQNRKNINKINIFQWENRQTNSRENSSQLRRQQQSQTQRSMSQNDLEQVIGNKHIIKYINQNESNFIFNLRFYESQSEAADQIASLTNSLKSLSPRFTFRF